ncbi:MAG TPA: tetratricopeptide repeat protein [Rhizomicrobium sp.]|jgi:tetratricopeptide (TPR) repeat protein
MADDDFEPVSGAPSLGSPVPGLALGARDALDPHAAKYLIEQTRLVQLQSQNMIEQNAFEVSHLKWRRYNDRLRGAWQTLAILFGAIVFALIAALLWDAHQATGLVVQPLSAPPDFAARGLDGTVLAQRLLDKLNGLVQQSAQYSVRTADSIGGNWGDDSKVEIPQTGVSVGELSRAVRGWLGNETRVSGEIWRSQKGIAISVRAGANPGVELNGSEADLDKLLGAAALTLLEQTQPFRYANLYMGTRRDPPKALAIFHRLAATSDGRERAWALAEIAMISPNADEATAAAKEAARLDPANPFVYSSLANVDAARGHGEAVVRDLQRALDAIGGRLPGDVLPSAVETLRLAGEAWLHELKGDFATAIAFNNQQGQRSAFDSQSFEWMEAAANAALAHDGGTARAILADHAQTPLSEYYRLAGQANFALPAQAILEMASGDWQPAERDLNAGDAFYRQDVHDDDLRHTLIWPWLAYVWAEEGELQKARDLIARTPHDCTLCLEMRGRIAELGHDTAGAAAWYAQATDDAPSLPFAAADWGTMRLAAGKYDAAIAKFALANKRCPHFADPLEMAGEALMLENRSDLALAKFAEADKYAPNWGRLHLKWGKALWFAGRKADAKRQFAIASNLDLTTSEESELARVINRV